MAVYVIGDVQGCYIELQKLLAEIRFDQARDRLWFAGDLISRGPRSLEVLRFVRELGDSAITVLGNHDLHLLAVVATGVELSERDESLLQIIDAPDCGELLDWLRQQPMLHHDDHSGFTMVHAGIPPQWDLATARACAEELEGVLRSDDYGTFFSNMYGDEPDIWRDDLKGWDRLRYITNCLTRMRYCDSQGRLLIKVKGPLGSQPQGYMPWFDVSGRASQSMNIVFGHWASLGWYEGDGVYGVDSGCVWGGELSALCLDDMSRTSVKCEGICDIGES